ncbi:MAG TPA: hypothetical protein VGB24_25265 [Longimicrobium sp.]|jgi:hypothetical protein|uniref:hypothetical protein n=1 Tax=Longimicrobium sp. TaxID=2029185 RepID=UPI002ED8074C
MKRILSALPLILLAACSSPFGSSGPELTVRTEQEEYVANPISFVHAVWFTVTNEGDESIYLPRCGAQVIVAVDRREGGDWRQAYGGSGICPAIYESGPMEVRPGDSVRSAAGVGVGRYRIRVRATDTPGSSRFDEAVSNAFTVEYSPMD